MLKATTNPYYQGPVSDHFDGTRFFNPQGQPPGSFRDLLKWQFHSGKVRWPRRSTSPFANARPQPRVEGSDLVVTMVNHATLLIQTEGLNILTDPVWSQRVSPVRFAGPKRVVEPGIAFDDLPKIDLVIVSHNHYDHLDLDTLKALHHRHQPLIVTPLGNDVIVRQAVPEARIVTQDWGDRRQVLEGLEVHCEPAHHWSARGTRDRRMALWAAFVLETRSGRIYHVGDTGFHDGINYRAAAEKFGHFRLAILPVGAYEPRWFMRPQHQDPDEAVRGFLLARADFAVGHHFGCFQLTNEGIDEPREELAEALARHHVEAGRFRPLLPGERFAVPAGRAAVRDHAATGNFG